MVVAGVRAGRLRRLGEQTPADGHRVDAALPTDAGPAADTGLDDSGLDAGALDAGALDAGALDAGALDAGALDAGALGDSGPDARAAADAFSPDTSAAPDGRAPGDSGIACTVAHRYDPATSPRLELWPDPLAFAPDPTSPTGETGDLDGSVLEWVDAAPPLFAGGLAGSDRISGAGRFSSVVFRMTGAVAGLPSNASESLSSSAVVWIDLDAAPPARVPFSAVQLPTSHAIVLTPLVPLRAGHRHVAALTRDLRGADGGCVAPSPIGAELFAGRSPEARFDEVAPIYPARIAEAGLVASEVVAVSYYTTHRDQDFVLLAADTIDRMSWSWSSRPTCMNDGPVRTCEASFEGIDFRDNGGPVLTGLEAARWTLNVSIWLPATGARPFPVAIYGHGMNGSRSGARNFAVELASHGIATVAMDAMRHGDHPTRGAGTPGPVFLGVDLTALRFDTLALRGNFEQTYLDRLELLRILEADPDIDGDGMDDIDPDRLGYWGTSLGGLLGPGTMSLSDHYDASMLTVGGGHLTQFILSSGIFSRVIGGLQALVGGADELEIFLRFAQSLVDSADPAVWADSVLRTRLRGSARPHVLLPVGEADQTVPPACGRDLARGLGIDHVRPVFTTTEPLRVIDAPASANQTGVTAAYFQFDRVGGAMPMPAGHNMSASPEGRLQLDRYWDSWVATGVPEVIDPYPMIGTPPL